MKRAGFTLIELMISVVILSVIMVFLYKTYAELNLHVKLYDAEVVQIEETQALKEVLFLDFSLMVQDSAIILNQDKRTDIVYFQSTHSIHERIHPYVGYVVQDKVLYRLESFFPLKSYPLDADVTFDIDKIGAVERFRVYKSNVSKELYLIDLQLKNKDEILLKIRTFNSK